MIVDPIQNELWVADPSGPVIVYARTADGTMPPYRFAMDASIGPGQVSVDICK